MSSVLSRAFARPVALVAALVLSILVGLPGAQARPPVKPGAVMNLVATVTKPAAAYQVATTWTASSNTTAYRVRLTNAAGSVLDNDTVTSTAWTAETTASAGTVVTVSVTPFNGARRGRAVTISRTLTDLTGPTGTFTVAESGLVGTVTQTAVSDDVSAADSITRSIYWGDGSAPQQWTDGTSIDHTYPGQGRYLPVVTLTDVAGNPSEVALDAIVIMDSTAPSGSYSLTPATGWASWTKVSVTQLALSDDFSPAANIERVVDWGDGGVPTPWTSGATLTHVYKVAGTFSPTVVVVDEAGNSAQFASASVTITKDSVAPVVTLTLPRFNKAAVRSWTVLKGRATDAGVGVRVVKVKAIEKRGSVFYAYRPLAKKWVKAGTSRTAAFQKAGLARAVPGANGVWKVRLAKLKLGKLIYRVAGVDRVSNVSKPLVHSQKLTRW